MQELISYFCKGIFKTLIFIGLSLYYWFILLYY